MNNVISICGALASNCKFSIVPGYLSYNYDYDYAVESTWPSSMPNSKGLTRTGNVLEVSGQYIYISFWFHGLIAPSTKHPQQKFLWSDSLFYATMNEKTVERSDRKPIRRRSKVVFSPYISWLKVAHSEFLSFQNHLPVFYSLAKFSFQIPQQIGKIIFLAQDI